MLLQDLRQRGRRVLDTVAVPHHAVGGGKLADRHDRRAAMQDRHVVYARVNRTPCPACGRGSASANGMPVNAGNSHRAAGPS